jgi:hypothetical protein
MIVTDQVQFRMPKDREYQFPAIAVLQAFINGFTQKMKENDVAGVQCARCGVKRTTTEKCLRCGDINTVPIATYKVAYDHDLDPERWQMFLAAGLILTSAPTKLTDIDMLVDMSDERINVFQSSGKHVCQVCGILSGIGCPPLPGITRRVPRIGDWKWATVDPFILDGLDKLTGEEIIKMEDQKYTGFIGYASWETYLVASMGLPMIEIVPDGRPRSWLSKFVNGGYRVVDSLVETDWAIREAKLSVEDELTKMALKQGAANAV